MIVSRTKDNFVVTFDSGLVLSNSFSEEYKKSVIFDFTKDHPTLSPNAIEISSAGEYEYNNVLFKVTPNLNTLISGEGIKIGYVNDIKNLDKDKNMVLAEVVLFDNITDKKLTSEDILNAIKILEPKVCIVNSVFDTAELPNFEKQSKLKIKRSDLDLVVDTKGYIF